MLVCSSNDWEKVIVLLLDEENFMVNGQMETQFLCLAVISFKSS